MKLTNSEIVQKTKEFVRKKLEGEASGHDWWHIMRVYNNAKRIGKIEKANLFVVELAALLHDIADWKFHGGDETTGAKVAKEWLESLEVDSKVIKQVYEIIATSSFKGAGVRFEMKTLEGKVVQDADRLDAIGAIGIARTFAYGGSKGRVIYDPQVKPEIHTTPEQYKNSVSHTINHFYEKLLLLKDRMNTKTGRKIAQERHKYMEQFLERFYKEWQGSV